MKTNTKIRFSAFLALSLIVFVSSIISFVRVVDWLGRTFPGFLLYQAPYVGSFSSRDWPGKKAGLHYLDRILAVDGKTVHSGREVVEISRTKLPGSILHYKVKSKEKIYEIAVPVAEFSLKDFFLVFFPPFFTGLAVYVLGIIVYLLKPNTRTSWVFLAMCFGVGVYGITGLEMQTTYSLVRLHYICASLFPACFIHFGLIFPERKQVLARFPVLEYLAYVPFLVGSLGFQMYTSALPEVLTGDASIWIPHWGLLSSFLRLFALFGFLCLIVLLLHSRFKSGGTQVRQRAKIIIFGVAVAFIPPAFLTVGAFAGSIYFPFNFIPFFVIFFPITIAYSIVQHNLFDADTIIRRTVGYAIVTLVVVSVYVGVSLALNVVAGRFQLAQSRAFPILFTFGIILIFNPLRNRIQALVDRVFFRKEYDYGEIVDRIGGAITSLLDLKEVLNRLVQTFVKDMFLSTGSILLLDAAGGGYRVGLAAGEEGEQVEQAVFGREDPLVQILEKEKRELTRYDVLEDPKYRRVRDACARGFDTVRASLMVPMVFQDQVIGLMSLGDKKSGKFFNREDVDLLHTLANQGAVAIENARLFEENLEKQRMEEELNIARDLQMSMLPAACPEVAGLDIAAFSVPAREVGGDFYDFIEMGKHKVGIVVGDVTGKSVSGALVMAASRSIFRMLSEQSLPVGEIMNYANRRTKKDIRSGMFVALLYVVVDGDKRTLRLCSAGQTQPIRLSSATGSTELIETEGDTFPLGILDEALYQETRIELDSGDRVVFYTDGIVEAMNEKEEIFGFDRLLEVVKEGSSLSADALLQLILERVNAFVGSAEQHDDLTVIVVSMEG